MNEVTHIVPISGGKDSTATALRLQELHPDIDFEYVITPTGDELPAMNKHWENIENLLGKKLTRLPVPTIMELIDEFSMLPNHRARWCTRVIKIEGVQEYYSEKSPAIVYVGLRADERSRQGNKIYDADIVQKYPMQEWGWGIGDVYRYLLKRGVSIPRRTDCGMCFWQRIDEWYSLWEEHPDRFREYEDLEFLIGHSFMTPGKHKIWPNWLFELRCEFEKGRKPTAVLRSEKRNARLKKQPNFFISQSNPHDYNMQKRCAVCSL
ncbi:MAG: phosphoadenosine phosphosulfate reductase family protein [Desulforhopalus sp.]